MNREDRRELIDELLARIDCYEREQQPLLGIAQFENRFALVCQFIDSIRRVQYVHEIRDDASISTHRTDPAHELFDPLKAAAVLAQQNSYEEACWLVFLATHFGKHKNDGWQIAKDIYGALNLDVPWTWVRASENHSLMDQWINDHYQLLITDGVSRRFSNHRKYESLRPDSNRATGKVISSYIAWINGFGSHKALFDHALIQSQGCPKKAFRWLYNSMNVLSFGRTAKFDYLTMLAKLNLANIEADSAYLKNATGPLRGAKLLFSGRIASNISVDKLERDLICLALYLNVGMQEIEDALCNWQKNPNRHIRFRG